MNHLLVAPVLLAAATGAVLLLLHRAPIALVRLVSLASTFAFFTVTLVLLAMAADGSHRVYALGNWPAPWGIVLVLDQFSALMLALTGLLAAAVVLYAAGGWDTRGRYFHAFVHFQLMGLAGAFATGDLFNLFVFFEVMLIASYCLMLQGLGAARLRATLNYVAVNLAASGVFLLAVSLLYGLTGTLNMAHLAERIAALPAEDVGLARTAGVLLLLVFAVKAALFPLYLWLPAGYANAAPPVAALFAIMTKVGVYAMVRMSTLLFPETNGSGVLDPWLLPLAVLTLVLSSLGALGARRLATVTAYLTIASVGTMLCAYAAAGEGGLGALLFYLPHSTIVIAILFLLGDLLARERGESGDALQAGPSLIHGATLGFAFFIAGAIVAGLPPTSGFLGKIMVLQSVRGSGYTTLVWSTVLLTSFITVVACVRAGSVLIWRSSGTRAPAAADVRTTVGEWGALLGLFVASAAMVVAAGSVRDFAYSAALQLGERNAYIEAVLGLRTEPLTRPLEARTR